MQRQGRLREQEAAPIFVGVASALDHLHQRGLLHRDVKAENVLLCTGGVAKLADFGWCAELSDRDARKTFCGTLDYLSPEMLRGEEHNHAVDIWAMGVLLYEMLAGHTPFAGRGMSGSMSRISSVDLKIPEAVPAAARDLIGRLLVGDPGSRLPLAEAGCDRAGAGTPRRRRRPRRAPTELRCPARVRRRQVG
ncbi:unnamed protein product [Prorocentrum cordatum]|uniref:Protein kinase domain-containing protein n=1 Tax=Prorocentrum cordatum TaxID=2364126 RepID=A0ABN9QRY5_9DINO|nr:unnamed protein product [Polarella glacialis]